MVCLGAGGPPGCRPKGEKKCVGALFEALLAWIWVWPTPPGGGVVAGWKKSGWVVLEWVVTHPPPPGVGQLLYAPDLLCGTSCVPPRPYFSAENPTPGRGWVVFRDWLSGFWGHSPPPPRGEAPRGGILAKNDVGGLFRALFGLDFGCSQPPPVGGSGWVF